MLPEEACNSSFALVFVNAALDPEGRVSDGDEIFKKRNCFNVTKLFPHFVQNLNPLKFYQRNPFQMNTYLDKFDFDNAEIESKISVSGISL